VDLCVPATAAADSSRERELSDAGRPSERAFGHATRSCYVAPPTNGKWAIVHPSVGADGNETGAHYKTQRAARTALAARRKETLSDETP
jgi:hypothetical protein